jgi:hypothetical protein
MGRSRSIGMSAGVAAVLTHGMVFSAVNLNDSLPISTYQGFFQHMVLATERLWSYAHGWQPMSHIHDFGRFYAPTVHLICPLIGFALFWIASRRKVGINFWKPLAIAVLLTIPPSFSDLVHRYGVPWVEVARTILIVLLMVWSVEDPANRKLRSFLRDPVRQPVPASL